jgi:hypothetical protein
MNRLTAVMLVSVGVLGCAPDATEPDQAYATDAPAAAAKTAVGGRAAATGFVYVRSQGLYYQTFVAVESLPMQGKFQLLENGETDYGPGDPGYLGGRWWEDLNGNGIQDVGDKFFLCPLLPPGRESPTV